MEAKFTERSKASQIYETLRLELHGASASGRMLPSERALMRRFSAARETVRRAMERLKHEGLVVRRVGKGTFPSRSARSRPARIGLIVLSYAEIFPPICAEIGRLCREQSIELLFGDVSALDYTARADQALRAAHDFVLRDIDGVILQPVGFVKEADVVNAEICGLFRSAEVPMVILGSDWPDARCVGDIVGIDNFRCGRAIAQHLASRGVRRGLYLSRPHCPTSNELRYHGARSVVKCELAFAAPDDRRAIGRLLKRHRPEAIICDYDAYAASLMKTLDGLGVSVPGDVLVSGFDDVKYATLVSPALTSVHQPCEEIARCAFDALLARVREPQLPFRTIYLQAPLVVRASTERNKKGRKTK